MSYIRIEQDNEVYFRIKVQNLEKLADSINNVAKVIKEHNEIIKNQTEIIMTEDVILDKDLNCMTD